jgi:hypothetical protein
MLWIDSTLIITSPLINGGAATDDSRSAHVFFMLISTASSQMIDRGRGDV